MVLAQRPNPAPAQKNPIAITNATIHTATGTVYFAIRSGGNDMKSGISIKNVEFRGVN